jgi:hypothetical protein
MLAYIRIRNWSSSSETHLVLEVDGCVEVWNFRVGRFADHLALACVQERSQLQD